MDSRACCSRCFLSRAWCFPGLGSAFRAWLEREQSTYSIWPAQKLLWAETIKYFPKLEAGLARAQAAKPPMPSFDAPSTSTAVPLPRFD